MLHVTKSVSINCPRDDVYRFWRDFENLPRFMQHLQKVTAISERRSHWVANGPAGMTVEWDAEIVADRTDELISWRSLPGSDITNEGSVRFTDAPADRGTVVHVELHYEAPAGNAGAAIAKLFGEEPSQQIQDDMRRFKQVLETGEVVLSDGSPEGAGQGMFKQRASQPAETETKR